MSVFQSVQQAAPDPILGLNEAFKADPHPEKINLGVGVFVDDTGRTPVLSCVKKAEQRLSRESASKVYLPMTGSADYTGAVQELLFGEELAETSARAFTAQTPGGTGGLRVAADFISKHLPDRKVWMSAPTWPNHPKVFAAAGVETATYRYFDADQNRLDFEGMLADLDTANEGDIVLLHACCHNPTGTDLHPAEWEQLATVLNRKQLLPFADFAYQGFAHGLEDDATGVRTLIRHCPSVLIANSFSKNFGLYNERIGGLTFVCEDAAEAARVGSQVKLTIRTNYSNPPRHGAAIVATILADPELRHEWERELSAMRERINGTRARFVEKLREHDVPRDFSFLTHQYGMFSFTGLSKEHVDKLREDHHIYMVGSGRINVAGITSHNIDRLCAALKTVLS